MGSGRRGRYADEGAGLLQPPFRDVDDTLVHHIDSPVTQPHAERLTLRGQMLGARQVDMEDES
jgi:hypothetical protein